MVRTMSTPQITKKASTLSSNFNHLSLAYQVAGEDQPYTVEFCLLHNIEINENLESISTQELYITPSPSTS